MKPINEMNLAELAYYLEHYVHISRLQLIAVIDRLRDLHATSGWVEMGVVAPNTDNHELDNDSGSVNTVRVVQNVC